MAQRVCRIAKRRLTGFNWLAVLSTLLLSPVAASELLVAPDAVYQRVNDKVDRDSIYRVEVLVFADEYQGDRNSEQWPLPVPLSYPRKLQPLYHHQQLANEIGYFRDELAHSSTEPATESIASTENAGTVSQDNSAPIPLLGVDYGRASTGELSTLARTMANRSRYRTLRYANWLQPLAPKEKVSVALAGGHNYGDWRELEGSVTISRGRYLHIDTNLWLVDWSKPQAEVAWYEQPAQRWRVPSRPVASSNHPVIRALQDKLENNDGGALEIDDASGQLVKRVRSARQVYLLKEKRRLKRNEIHYLDHPMFGVVVAISKWSGD